MKLANNIIVGAGSAVTKSFKEEGEIIGGNPARIIGTIENFKKNNTKNQMLIKELKTALETNDSRLIKRN